MAKRGRGRPTRYSREIHATIVGLIKAGAFKAHAARAACVSISALEHWLALGRAGDRRYERFALDVMKAQAEDAIRSQAIITRAALSGIPGSWRAAAWNLERKHVEYRRAPREPAVSVELDAKGEVSADEGDGDEASRTRVIFYTLPANGRRLEDEDTET